MPISSEKLSKKNFAALALLLAVVYFLIAKLGLTLATLNNNTSPFWPATGFAIVVVFILGARYSVAVFLAAFAVNFFADTPLTSCFLMATGNSLEALFGAWLLRYISSRKTEFEFLNELLAVLCASLVAPVVSASFGTLGVSLRSSMSSLEITNIWLTWWRGDLIGGLTVIPLGLALRDLRLKKDLMHTLTSLKFLALALLLGVALFYSFKNATYIGGVFVIFPLLLIIQLTLGPLALFTCSLGASILAVALTVKGIGPFTGASINENLLNLQLFISSLALTAMVLEGLSRIGRPRLPALILLVLWTLSSLLFTSFQNTEIKKDSTRFYNLTKDLEHAIQTRMNAYVDALYGGVSLITSIDKVTPDIWRRFYLNSTVDKRYPGINGVGIIWPVKSHDLKRFIQKERKSMPDFTVKAVPDQDLLKSGQRYGNHFIITYIEPLQGNAPARGLDVGSESHRRFAAETSRDSGTPRITPKINLVQDVVVRPGFLLFVPFYKTNAELQTIEDRRRNHLGWVYAPFITHTFFVGISTPNIAEISFSVFEGDHVNESSLLFNSSPKTNHKGDFEKTSALKLAGLDLTIGWNRTVNFQSSRSTTAGWVALACAILSLLVALVIAILQSIGLRAQAIAEEKTSELSQSEKKFRTMVESSMIGTVISQQDGLIIDGNTPFLRLLGVADRNLKKDPLPWSQITQDTSFLKSVASPDESPYFSGEINLTKADGSSLPALVGSARLLGQTLNTISYIIDLTESKRTQRDLMISELKFRSVADTAVDAIVIMTEQGLITSWNEGARKIFGHREETLTKPLLDLIEFTEGENPLPKEAQTFSDRISPLLGKSTEVQARRADGSLLPVELTLSSWEVEGEKFYSAIIRDISERKKFEQELIRAREEALEGVKTKSAFMANMSHEIRTPLNGIIGVADLLFETDLTSEQKRYAEIIQSSGSNLLNIINDILDFSKIEAGKLSLENIPFDLALLTEVQTELMMAKARSKNLALVSYIDPSLPGQFIGDPSRLGQILSNLISNAVKFTATGGVKIIVTSPKNVLQNPDLMMIRIEVIDSGIGISEQGISKLFQPFNQVDESTSRHYGGTGLGLSICKSLVAMMGGQIGVHSKLNHGSTFWFEIPLIVSPEGRAPKTTAHLKNLSGLNILVVEPEPFSGEVLTKYLSAWAIPHDSVQSLAEAMTVIKASPHDSSLWPLILLSSGDVEPEALWSFEKNLRLLLGPLTPQLILVCEFESSLSTDTIKEHGYAQILRKPLKQAELFSAILLSTQPSGSPLSRSATADRARRASSSKRVLIVDDVGTNRLVVVQLLEKIGYSGFAVASGEEALQALALMPFDLILMDVQMPEMDGYETTRRIRNFPDPAVSKLPIIALTANALAGDEAKCLDAGMDDYLAKPVRMAVLAEKLKGWFEFGKDLDTTP